MNLKYLSLVVLMIGLLTAHCLSLNREQVILYEQFNHPETSEIGMFGFGYKTHVLPPFYYGLSLLEAVSGKHRAGYAVFSIGLGAEHSLTDDLILDSACYIGSGGGGLLSKYVAGGLSYKFQIGLKYMGFALFAPSIHVGVMTYPINQFNNTFLSFGASYFFSIETEAKQLNPSPLKRSQWELGYKSFTYNNETKEMIQLIGGQRKKMITDHWYWGESGYAAITGNRHGYIQIGLLSGLVYKISPMFFDISINIGAGGGGGYLDGENTGLLFQLNSQFGIQLSNQLSLSLDFGNMTFPTGKINSMSTGASINYSFNQR